MDYLKGAATLVILLAKLWSGRRSSHNSNSVDDASRQSDSEASTSDSADSNPLPLPIQEYRGSSHYSNSVEDASRQSDSVASASDSADSNLLPLPTEYEVFLNFRGSDTRYQITDILYRFLVDLKIRTFKHDDDLRKGEEIWPSLVEAIEQSKIYVPILSENYAYSKWCLRELAAIVERQEQDQRCIILPVFYMVDPRDVRHKSGPFKKAFEQHKKSVDEKTIQVWEDALIKVGEMRGCHIKSNDEQGALADLVTDSILSHLSTTNGYVLHTDELVGIDGHIKAIEERMTLGSGGVSVVGIHGIGGIGKTTIAKAVCNKLAVQFDRCSYVGNVREMLLQKDGVIRLQKQLISGSGRWRNSVESISNTSEGRKIIKETICHFKCLIVLDDVDEMFELEEMLGNIKNFVSGSRFIMTSRNVKVLITSAAECKLYKVQEMSDQHSLQLFCQRGFGMDSPPQDYQTLAKAIVFSTAGLPLAIKVVGSLLFRRQKAFWREKLRQIQETPVTHVADTLKISYDTLNEEAKQIFLDIACFFNGEDKELSSYMWSNCNFFPMTNIKILIQRSMLEIGDNGLLRMHDQLRRMGRQIVCGENIRYPWERSRIWSEELGLDMLRNKMGTKYVEGVVISSSEELEKECFMNLSQLRYLDLEAQMHTDDFSNYLPNLRWLRLRIGNGEHMPKFCVENLVFLEVLCPVSDGWGGLRHIKMASKLKVLTLSGEFLIECPCFPPSGSLEILSLQNFILDWSSDSWNLINLKVLRLRFCVVREIRGGASIGMLKWLRELIIFNSRYEENSREALGDIGELQFLEILRVDVIDDLGRTPDDERLLLGVNLPRKLKVLQTLSPVANLPMLLELEELTIRYSEYGLEIPPADNSNMWWKLSKLKYLMLERTKMASPSPSSLSSLLPSSLITLDITVCPELEWLPNLENLQNLTELFISGGPSLKQISELGCCPLLKEIPGLGGLKSLKSLYLSDLEAVCNLDGLGELKSLGTLTISGLEALCSLDGLDSLYSLTSLNLAGCHALERLPSLASLGKLLVLDISSCHSLTVIQGLGGLKSLEKLEIVGADSLSRLIGLQTLLSYNKLETLTIFNCFLLTSLPFHELDDECRLQAVVLDSLRKLNIRGIAAVLQIFCRMLHLLMFPSLTELHLTGVNIHNADTKLRLDGLESMEELVELHLCYLASVRRLPSLSRLGKLKVLSVTSVPNLREIEGLPGLKSLEVLDLKGCTSLERLPADQLSGLKQLKRVDISDCENLIDRSALRKLEPEVQIQS